MQHKLKFAMMPLALLSPLLLVLLLQLYKAQAVCYSILVAGNRNLSYHMPT
jgi:hypothetical protein